MSAVTGTRLGPVIAAVFAVALIAGCTAHAEPHPSGSRIATLATPSASPDGSSAPSSPPSSSVDALIARYGPPARDRLDDSDDDTLAKNRPYLRCVADNGGPDKLTDDPHKNDGLTNESVRLATELCAPLQPLPPIEYDRQNPDALHFVQAVVDCLKAKGVKGAAIAPDDGGGRWNIQFDDAGAGLRFIGSCETAASGA